MIVIEKYSTYFYLVIMGCGHKMPVQTISNLIKGE